LILHITSRMDWEQAQRRGEYRAPSLAAEGFIHCSTEAQVLPVANAFYRGRSGLVLLVIDEARLESRLEWEPPAGPTVAGISGSDLFPHVYGPINLAAVASVPDFGPDPAGTFNLPPLT
jgi:uncharacterized protein (DUF952 family)